MEFLTNLRPLYPLLIVLFSMASTWMLFIIKQKNEKIRSIEKQLSDKKYNLYLNIFNLVFSFLHQENLSGKNNNLKEQETQKLIIEIKKELLIYAPDPIVKAFLDYLSLASDSAELGEQIPVLLNLLTLIRRDMGNDKTIIKGDEILLMIMHNQNEVRLFKESNRIKFQKSPFKPAKTEKV